MAVESDRPAGPKLRDSCDQCATAKVRCTKERPTCARCERRGHGCEYSSTKRAGRRSHAKSQADNTLRGLTPRPSCPQAQPQSGPSSNPSGDPTTSPTGNPAYGTTAEPSCHVQHGQQTPGTSDAMSHLSSTSPLPGTGIEFDDIFGNIAGMPEIGTLDHSITYPSFDSFGDTRVGTVANGSSDRTAGSGLFSQNGITSSPGTPGFDYMSLLEDFGTEPVGPSGSQSPAVYNMSLFNVPTTPLAALPVAAEICDCTARVLHIYTETSEPIQTDRTSANDASKRLRAIASSVKQSKKTTEVLDGFVRCNRSQNASLLVIVGLVLFNLLGRCAEAIKRPASDENRSRDQSPTSSTWSRSSAMSSYLMPSQEDHSGADGEDPLRVALQGLLAELLNIKRLVTSLSERLPANSDNTDGSDDAMSVETADSGQDRTSMMADGGSSLPFSANLASHTMQDLCTYLRILSQQIVGVLRAG